MTWNSRSYVGLFQTIFYVPALAVATYQLLHKHGRPRMAWIGLTLFSAGMSFVQYFLAATSDNLESANCWRYCSNSLCKQQIKYKLHHRYACSPRHWCITTPHMHYRFAPANVSVFSLCNAHKLISSQKILRLSRKPAFKKKFHHNANGLSDFRRSSRRRH